MNTNSLKRSSSAMAKTTSNTAWTPTREATDLMPHRRSFSDVPSPCPSLLSEHVDERVERFMTLPSPPIQDSPFFPSSINRKKRMWSEADERDTYDVLTRRQRSFGTKLDDRTNDSLYPSYLGFLHDDGDNDLLPKPPKLVRTPPIDCEQDGFESVEEQYSTFLSSSNNASSLKQWPPPMEATNTERFPSWFDKKPAAVPQEQQPRSDYESLQSVIDEQKSIMDEIRREQNSSSSRNTPTRASKASAFKSSVREEQKPVAVGIPSGNKKNSVELCPGTHVRILDRSHALAAISNENASVFTCAGCKTNLLAANDTKLLFCSGCGTLTPTNLCVEIKND